MSVSACTLDLAPTTAIDKDQAFQTYADAEQFANGMASRFRSSIYGQYDYTAEVQTDMFNASLDYGNRNGGPHTMSESFTDGDYNIRDLWRQLYSSILSTNNFLSNIDKITFKEGEKAKADVLKGRAHFYRAFYYHKLLRYYAKPYDATTANTDLAAPLILEYNVNELPKRATVAQVYAQVNADLELATGFLTGVAGKVRADMPTIDAVNALKARVALFMKDYSKAAQFADAVINSAAGYKLCKTDAEMKDEWVDDKGTEDIMQLFASLSEFGASPQGSGSSNSRLAMDIYIGYSNNTKLYVPDFIPTQTCINQYEANDIRLKAWFKKFPCKIGGNSGDLVLLNKYPGNPELYQGTSNYAQKPKAFRLGEMYLIAAEAYLNLDGGKAAQRLNDLQAARGASQTEASEATVRAEWAKEMIGEGYRMDCMKRWNIGFTDRIPQNANMTQSGSGFNKITIPAGDYHFTWAIPSYERQVNPNLEQNPGWN